MPPYFAHEGFVLEMFEGEQVPKVLAAEPDKVLMLGIPGEDKYNAPFEFVNPLVSRLVNLQWRYRDRTNELLSRGVPDWRGEWFVQSAQRVIELYRGLLTDEQVERLDQFSELLPAKLAELDQCGFPETFIHGYYHQGN